MSRSPIPVTELPRRHLVSNVHGISSEKRLCPTMRMGRPRPTLVVRDFQADSVGCLVVPLRLNVVRCLM